MTVTVHYLVISFLFMRYQLFIPSINNTHGLSHDLLWDAWSSVRDNTCLSTGHIPGFMTITVGTLMMMHDDDDDKFLDDDDDYNQLIRSDLPIWYSVSIPKDARTWMIRYQ